MIWNSYVNISSILENRGNPDLFLGGQNLEFLNFVFYHISIIIMSIYNIDQMNGENRLIL